MRHILLILFLAIGLTTAAQVQPRQLKRAESSFRQTRISVMLENPEVREGSFLYIAPDSIRWCYDGMENVKLPKQMLSLIRQAVSGDVQTVKSMFRISWHGNDMMLTPLKNQVKRFFSTIKVTFTNDGVAKRVLLTEPNGDTTEIEFLKLKYTAK